jgi:hypothetical protein
LLSKPRRIRNLSLCEEAFNFDEAMKTSNLNNNNKTILAENQSNNFNKTHKENHFKRFNSHLNESSPYNRNCSQGSFIRQKSIPAISHKANPNPQPNTTGPITDKNIRTPRNNQIQSYLKTSLNAIKPKFTRQSTEPINGPVPMKDSQVMTHNLSINASLPDSNIF